MDELDMNSLEALFIEETFHRSEPIRCKPVRTEGPIIQKVWVKDFKIDQNGVKIKVKPIKNKLNHLFTQLQTITQQMGLQFEGDGDEDDEEDDQFEDINTTDEKLSSNGLVNSRQQKKMMLSLANKLKKKSICNRLGIAYTPGKNKLKDTRTRLGTSKSWSEKFGRLLAAKKLLYLPLLYRKYNSGPRKTREELDIEIDLYMAEVKKAMKHKCKLAFNQISNTVNNRKSDEENEDTNNVNNGITVLNNKKLFGGFGGPKWRKRLELCKESEGNLKEIKESLDMEIDSYMKNKDKNIISVKTEYEEKDELDMDLDNYMARVKNNKVKTQVITNHFR